MKREIWQTTSETGEENEWLNLGQTKKGAGSATVRSGA